MPQLVAVILGANGLAHTVLQPKKYTFTMPAGNVTDTANTTLDTYSISYTLNGGSVSGNPTSYNVTTGTFTLKNPTRSNYRFTG